MQSCLCLGGHATQGRTMTTRKGASRCARLQTRRCLSGCSLDLMERKKLSVPNSANTSQCKLQPIQQRVSSGTRPSVRYISHHVYRKENHGTASGFANSHKHVQHQPGMSQDTRPSIPSNTVLPGPSNLDLRPTANQPSIGTAVHPSSCPISHTPCSRPLVMPSSHTPTANPYPSPWYTSSTRSPPLRRPGSSPAPARSPSAGAPPRGPWP